MSCLKLLEESFGNEGTREESLRELSRREFVAATLKTVTLTAAALAAFGSFSAKSAWAKQEGLLKVRFLGSHVSPALKKLECAAEKYQPSDLVREIRRLNKKIEFELIIET